MNVEALIDRLRAESLTVATCESITGGGIGSAITDVAGASDVFRGGLITYATDLKTTLAGVPVETAERFGVVSTEVATEMAKGARLHCGADIAVATTGFAGPTADGKAIGTVCIAVATPSRVIAREFQFTGDRAQVRAQAVDQALIMVLENAWELNL